MMMRKLAIVLAVLSAVLAGCATEGAMGRAGTPMDESQQNTSWPFYGDPYSPGP